MNGVGLVGLDALAVGLARATPRRGLLKVASGLVALAMAGRAGGADAATFDQNCRDFVLSGGRKSTKKLDDVDDDVKFEIRRKGSSGWDLIYNDDDGSVNSDGKPIPTKLLQFKGRVGDQIRITLTNAQPGGCSLDAIWLFCQTGRGSGKKLLPAFRCNSSQAGRIGIVSGFPKVVKIEP